MLNKRVCNSQVKFTGHEALIMLSGWGKRLPSFLGPASLVSLRWLLRFHQIFRSGTAKVHSWLPRLKVTIRGWRLTADIKSTRVSSIGRLRCFFPNTGLTDHRFSRTNLVASEHLRGIQWVSTARLALLLPLALIEVLHKTIKVLCKAIEGIVPQSHF